MNEPELLLAHRDFVRAVAAEIVGDAASIDDVEQETMLAAWRRGGETTRSWRGFLATLARNFARQFRRGEKRRRRREEQAAPRERTPSVAEVVAREEQRRAVVAAVLALEEPERGAVLLRFYEGVPPREIARRLAIPVETARTRVKRGVERVRARLLVREEGQERRLLAWLVPLAQPLATSAPAVPTAALAAAAIVLAALSWPALREGGWLRPARGGGRVADAPAPAVVRAATEDGVPRPAEGDATRAPERAPADNDAAGSGAPTQTFHGRVVDARGAPVGGARVDAWGDVLSAPVTLDEKRIHATSGADGGFALAIPATLDRCTLVATAAGRSPGTVLSATSSAEVTIVLEDDDLLVGTVSNSRGEAIPGARVHGVGMHGGALFQVNAKSGADGGYRLPYPTADRAAWQGDGESWRWWVEVTAAGFAPLLVVRERDLDPDHAAGETPCNFVLRCGATLTGSVVDAASGAPLADARVVAVAFEDWMSFGRNVGGSLPNPCGERIVGEARSDEAGLFVIEHLRAATAGEAAEGKNRRERRDQLVMMNLYAFAPDHAPGFTTVSPIVEDQSADVRLALWHPATIVGRVVDGEGLPLPHVRVAATEEITSEQRRAGRMARMRAQVPRCVGAAFPERVLTDANGRYEIGGLPAESDGDVPFRIALDDYDWETQHEEGAQAVGVVVAARAGAVVAAPDLVAAPERSVVLEVVDEQGAPITGARIHREPRSFDDRATDVNGRLRWIEPDFTTHMSDGTIERFPTIRLRIARRGFATVVTDPIAPSKSDAALLRVVMARGHALRGSVVDPLQRPAPRAGVTVWRHPPTPEERAELDHRRGDPTLQLSDTATDGDGRFFLDDLPDGPVFVSIHPPIAWKDRRPGAAATFADVPVDGAPLTFRLADK